MLFSEIPLPSWPPRLPLPSYVVAVVTMLLLATTTTLAAASAASPSSNNNNNNNINSVVIVGGTHGNEYTGIWCIQALQRPSARAQLQRSYPSLQISTLLGNPAAFLANRRFVDVDLNRQFTKRVLTGYGSDTENEASSLESQRAREVNQVLGPKRYLEKADHGTNDNTDDGNNNDDDNNDTTASTTNNGPAADVVIDCHSTTANMGLTIIVAEGDELMTRAAAYIMHKCNAQFQQDDNDSNSPVFRTLVHGTLRSDQPFLPSTGRHGLTLEVGPVPQGLVRHDAVRKTQAALRALLEFLERHNQGDHERVDEELQRAYSHRNKVPCFVTAPPVKPTSNTGKIAWPCHPDNPNFPQWMVHGSVQDGDFGQISEGDALFEDLDGNVIPYDGSFGSPVHLIFVNEVATITKRRGRGLVWRCKPSTI